MRDGDVTVLRGEDVLGLLAGCEAEVLEVVGSAYVAHLRGLSSLPHSSFLRFPDDDRNRIIALPAYVGDGFASAGIKWIASFPGNLEKGLDSTAPRRSSFSTRRKRGTRPRSSKALSSAPSGLPPPRPSPPSTSTPAGTPRGPASSVAA